MARRVISESVSADVAREKFDKKVAETENSFVKKLNADLDKSTYRGLAHWHELEDKAQKKKLKKDKKMRKKAKKAKKKKEEDGSSSAEESNKDSSEEAATKKKAKKSETDDKASTKKGTFI